jgi:4-amino-4-deoxy-L-arabinose transferase-like glycosyltransferase
MVDHGAGGVRGGRAGLLVLGGLSLALLLYHLLTSALGGYGFFIDEFYYVACSKRLALGYVDHPPLSVLMLALSRRLLGDSIVAVRFLPALGAAVTAFMTGLIARRLGGSRGAVTIAALAACAMPVFLLMGSFFSMNAFEPLVWTAILYLVIRLVQENDARYWLAIGLLMGIGLELKHTMVLYGIALGSGMLLTDSRRLLWTRWLGFGIVACFLLVAPNLVWQYLHGFPSLEFYRNAMVNKNIPTGPGTVVLQQVLFANPVALPVWGAGLAYLVFSKEGRKYRFLAWAYLLLLLVMIVGRSSRPDRIGAMYTALFAAGAVALERIARPALRRVVVLATVAALLASGAALAPLFTPLLPPPAVARYVGTLGLRLDIEIGKTNEAVPQWLADRLGWRELAADVGRVVRALPDDERASAVIVSTNYGEAGALELFGPEFGLPRVFATHNSYHSWGPPPASTRTFVAVFVDREALEGLFDSVTEAAVHTCEHCSRPQKRIPIYVARDPRVSISAEWPRFKIYS